MKYLLFPILLMLAFNACTHKERYSHGYYHSTHPVVYEYVPLTPLVSPNQVFIEQR